MYKILNHKSKYKILYQKINYIHILHTGSCLNQHETVVNSISEMKQDMFNPSFIFMENHDESIKVHVHDSSRDEILKERGILR